MTFYKIDSIFPTKTQSGKEILLVSTKCERLKFRIEPMRYSRTLSFCKNGYYIHFLLLKSINKHLAYFA